jgi:transcription antitermination factor NusG
VTYLGEGTKPGATDRSSVAPFYPIGMRDHPSAAPVEAGQRYASTAQHRWCAVYVIARHEKVIADQMTRRSVESFLPLYRSVRNWKDRRVQVDWPLFPSYLFIRISLHERVRALQVPGVVHIVSFQGMPVTVPEEQIESLRTALKLRRSEPYPYLAAGQRIRIKAGALQGLEGIVVRQNSQTRIVVSIDFIQRSTSVELWPEDLECLPDSGRAQQKLSRRV